MAFLVLVRQFPVLYHVLLVKTLSDLRSGTNNFREKHLIQEEGKMKRGGAEGRGGVGAQGKRGVKGHSQKLLKEIAVLVCSCKLLQWFFQIQIHSRSRFLTFYLIQVRFWWAQSEPAQLKNSSSDCPRCIVRSRDPMSTQRLDLWKFNKAKEPFISTHSVTASFSLQAAAAVLSLQHALKICSQLATIVRRSCLCELNANDR